MDIRRLCLPKQCNDMFWKSEIGLKVLLADVQNSTMSTDVCQCLPTSAMVSQYCANVCLPLLWYHNIVPMFNHVVLMFNISWCFPKNWHWLQFFLVDVQNSTFGTCFAYVMLCQCLTMCIAVCQHCINVLAKRSLNQVSTLLQ